MVNELLKKLGYDPLDRQENLINIWEQYFKGNVENFHEYTEYIGAEVGATKRRRKSLKLPKVISEIWADNIINPETKILINGDGKQDWFNKLDIKLGIIENLNDLMELTFALGTGATVQSKDKDGNVFNQYLSIQSIYPLKSKFGEIVSCAFASKQGKEVYIQIHELQTNGKYIIRNKYFDENKKEIIKEDVEPEFESDIKLFQLYKPAIVNNFNLGNPLGISIYANALEESRSVDIAYDAMEKEVRNGRTRIFLRSGALIPVKGRQRPIFDKDQDEFYILPEDDVDNNGDPLTIKQGQFNTEPLINVLEKNINLMGSKCGLGDNAFYSKDGTIYTNTSQVVSSNSKFYKTRQKHATRIEKSLIEMVKALYYLDQNRILEESINVQFDDSIIHDKDEEYNRSRLEVMQGLKSHIQHFMDTMDMSESEATKYWKKQIELMGLQPNVEEEGGEV